jgi:hypothetical protein
LAGAQPREQTRAELSSEEYLRDLASKNVLSHALRRAMARQEMEDMPQGRHGARPIENPI